MSQSHFIYTAGWEEAGWSLKKQDLKGERKGLAKKLAGKGLGWKQQVTYIFRPVWKSQIFQILVFLFPEGGVFFFLLSAFQFFCKSCCFRGGDSLCINRASKSQPIYYPRICFLLTPSHSLPLDHISPSFNDAFYREWEKGPKAVFRFKLLSQVEWFGSLKESPSKVWGKVVLISCCKSAT